MEGSPLEVDLLELMNQLKGIEHVKAIHDFHVWSISVGKYACSAHITCDNDSMEIL
jgi:Co/Zn/Cd efflux system component